MDILIPKKNIVLDATMLTALMNCPRFCDFRFNMHLQPIGGKSNSLEVGSVVHKFLEVYYRTIIQGLPKEQAVGFGMAAAELYIRGCPSCTEFKPTDEQPKPECGHIPNDYPGIQNTQAESSGYIVGWKWALTTCEQYVEYYRNDSWVPLEVEVVKSSIIYEDDDIRILWKAKLDMTSDTNQGIFPVDHKTMKQNRASTSINNQFMGQCITMKTRNMIVNKVGFQKTLKPEEKFKREVVSYSASRLNEWQNVIVPYYAKLLLMYEETEHFPPNFTNCDGKFGACQFTKVCESDVNMREEELKIGFKIGPEWNPTNEATDSE